jgi:hypothetical protein
MYFLVIYLCNYFDSHNRSEFNMNDRVGSSLYHVCHPELVQSPIPFCFDDDNISNLFKWAIKWHVRVQALVTCDWIPPVP